MIRKNCKTVSTGKFSIFEDVDSFDEEELAAEAVQEDTGIWSLESEDNEGEGGEEEEDLDLFASATLGRFAWLFI
jgi:hypothetical protein